MNLSLPDESSTWPNSMSMPPPKPMWGATVNSNGVPGIGTDRPMNGMTVEQSKSKNTPAGIDALGPSRATFKLSSPPRLNPCNNHGPADEGVDHGRAQGPQGPDRHIAAVVAQVFQLHHVGPEAKHRFPGKKKASSAERPRLTC